MYFLRHCILSTWPGTSCLEWDLLSPGFSQLQKFYRDDIYPGGFLVLWRCWTQSHSPRFCKWIYIASWSHLIKRSGRPSGQTWNWKLVWQTSHHLVRQQPGKSNTKWFTALCSSIRKASDTTIPLHNPTTLPDRHTCPRTNKLFLKRTSIYKRRGSKKEFHKITKEIKQSTLLDYKNWVTKCVAEMEKANKVDNTIFFQTCQQIV